MQITDFTTRILIKKAIGQPFNHREIFIQAIPFFIFSIFYLIKFLVLFLKRKLSRQSRIVTFDIETDGLITFEVQDKKKQ